MRAKPATLQLNRRHPLGAALLHAWEFPGGDVRDGVAIVPDLARGQGGAAPLDLTMTARTAGAPAYVQQAEGWYLQLARFHRAEAAVAAEGWWQGQRCSVEMLLRVTDESSTPVPAIGCFWQPVTNQQTGAIELSYNDTWYWGVRDADGNYAYPNGNGAVAVGDYAHCILVIDGAALRFYLNGELAQNGALTLGVSDGSNSFSTNAQISQSTPAVPGLGSAQTSGYENHIGFDVALCRIYDRPLSALDVARLQSDPWVAYRHSTPIYLLTPVASGPTYVDAAASVAATSTVAADSQRVRTAEASLASASTVAADSQRVWDGAASLAAQSTVAADSQRLRPAAASLSSASTTTGDSQRVRHATAAVSSTSTVAADSQVVSAADAAASVSASSTVAASAVVLRRGTAAVLATSSVTASVAATLRGVAAVTATSTVTARAVIAGVTEDPVGLVQFTGTVADRVDFAGVVQERVIYRGTIARRVDFEGRI